ncbi:MAG: hypothetical protein ACLRX5_10135 [Slackia sp.]
MRAFLIVSADVRPTPRLWMPYIEPRAKATVFANYKLRLHKGLRFMLTPESNTTSTFGAKPGPMRNLFDERFDQTNAGQRP